MTRRRKHVARGVAAQDDESPRRVIVTKRKTYEIPITAQGTPGEKYFPGVELPEPLKGSGAKVYATSDGPVIGMPAPRQSGRQNPRRRAAGANVKPTP